MLKSFPCFNKQYSCHLQDECHGQEKAMTYLDLRKACKKTEVSLWFIPTDWILEFGMGTQEQQQHQILLTM